MQWKKRGLVYRPDGSAPWAVSHAMIPTPVVVDADTIRVFVTFCDEHFIGRPGYVDVDARDPTRVLRVSPKPLLDLGEIGTFDDNGALCCSVVRLGDGRLYMYYAGFELGVKVRYKLFTGLAVSDDGGESFRRVRQTPVLDRSDTEMTFRGGPYARLDGDRFRLWYVSGSEWEEIDGKAMPVYVLKYLESEDGVEWGKEGRLVLDLTGDDEHGFGRPWVTNRSDGRYQLFYSIRRRSLRAYRLGYAESEDGLNWIRMDDAMGLDVTPGEFDSDAIMYAAVVTVEGRTYCFYNGNHFGRDGFAVAELTTP
jgi:predicted GH43/DUF377 family glycosyl hydrolase